MVEGLRTFLAASEQKAKINTPQNSFTEFIVQVPRVVRLGVAGELVPFYVRMQSLGFVNIEKYHGS